MTALSRRRLLQLAAAGYLARPALAADPIPGERPAQDASVSVLNPCNRVPLSFIIDDSTCLVNLNRFSIPQFAAAHDYKSFTQDWRSMPAEIPDAFVRKFGEWCGEHEIKGKYSIVPYPACVGRIDRELPGWTSRQLKDSIDLVRNLMMPNWDIHPEMVTHTRVIDTKTGHPIPQYGLDYMENWRWANGRSVDELTNYLSYALGILKNVGLDCEGITTPGGFASGAKAELAQAAFQSVRDVFGSEIPHYFKYLIDSGSETVQPRVEYASGLDTDDPRCVVSIVACTGDWTGGWDCVEHGDVDKFITPDLNSGRMVEVIDRGEPALMLAHWTGIHFNGQESGFNIFQEAVRRMHAKYDNLRWMKLSEIARYWAAKELTAIRKTPGWVHFNAPFAAPDFTVQVAAESEAAPHVASAGSQVALVEVRDPLRLTAGTFYRQGGQVTVCFDLPKGASQVLLGATLAFR